MSDVTVTVTGLPFDQKAVSGVAFDFSYNTIPVASLQLVSPYIEKNHRDFLCDPDSFKKKTRDSFVKISVKSKTGCLNFEGVFDGLSFSQSPGAFSYSAIIKSKFQSLLEIYPKLIGLDPSSLVIFKRDNQFMQVHAGNAENPFQSLKVGGLTVPVAGKSLLELYIAVLKHVLTSQQNLVSNTTQEFAKILKLMQDDIYKKNIEKAMSILDEIDISAVKDNKILAEFCLSWIVDSIVDSPDTMWDSLLSGLEGMGCLLLPGVKKLFIIPKANFLKLEGSAPSSYGAQSTEPNQAWPADYSNFMISDRSYRNLRACFVVPADINAQSSAAPYGSWKSNIFGVYPKPGSSDIKDDGSTGILIKPVPPFFANNLTAMYTYNQLVQSNLKEAEKPFAGTPVTESNTVSQQITGDAKKNEALIDGYSEIYDDLAKSYFLQEKYEERGGAIQLLFNPKWVPGTTGFVYSRHPSLCYNFFVSSVKHEISLGSGNSGYAQTTVSFSSSRYAGNPSSVPGTDKVDLYKYDEGKMKSVQQQWLSDIGN